MLNYHILSNHFNRYANNLSHTDFVTTEIAKRMNDRLDYIKINPHNILDLATGIGIDSQLLKYRYQNANIYKVDIAKKVLQTYHNESDNLICANMLQLPIARNSIDLVWSNLGLAYIFNFKEFFKQISQILTQNGTFLITGLGVDSLKELRKLGLSTFNFPDMHTIGDILLGLGFSNPVLDVEYVTIEYDTLDELINDIKTPGAGVALETQHKLKKQTYQDLNHKFSDLAQKQNNCKFKLTLEIFYAHAWLDYSKTTEQETKIIKFYK